MKIQAVHFSDYRALRTVTRRVCKQLGCPESWVKSVTYVGADNYPTGEAFKDGHIGFRMPPRKLFPIKSLTLRGVTFPAYQNQREALAAVLAHEVTHLMACRLVGAGWRGETAPALAEFFILRPVAMRKIFKKVCVRFD